MIPHLPFQCYRDSFLSLLSAFFFGLLRIFFAYNSDLHLVVFNA